MDYEDFADDWMSESEGDKQAALDATLEDTLPANVVIRRCDECGQQFTPVYGSWNEREEICESCYPDGTDGDGFDIDAYDRWADQRQGHYAGSEA